jgi:hypothetical protein
MKRAAPSEHNLVKPKAWLRAALTTSRAMSLSCLTMVVLLTAVALVSGARESPTFDESFWGLKLASIPGRAMALGCEGPGIYLDLVYTTLPIGHVPPQRYTRLRLSQGGRPMTDRSDPPFRSYIGGQSTPLTDLKQLRGLLQVADGRAALRLVRLRTSPDTCYAWGGERLEVEVFSATQARAFVGARTDRTAGWLHNLSARPTGLLGVLHDAEYRAGGFEPAHVERVEGGFEVTRWIFWTSGHAGDAVAPPRSGIQQVREFVGVDGEYRRSTLADVGVEKAPRLNIPFSFR